MYTALIHGLAVLEIFYLGRNKKEYVNIAISKELKEVAIVREHVLRNSKIPVIALAGLQFANLMSGVVITETIFSWPSIENYF